ncbi:STAS/SEC14 domain-containing protein [Sorangium sp. So ce861]|uniref:STAS/SEC14 domain-containing protein n=1 Tax=Sorangium sp. So ce861 TaxID=3133323 RepID=UPI003F5D887F
MSEHGTKDESVDVHEEPDGVLRLTIRGELTEDRARAVFTVIRRVAESGRHVLVLADARHMGIIPPLARKVLTEEVRSARVDAVALVGASFSVRVIVALLAKGIHMITKRPYPQQFFATEEEARAWLFAQREALRAERRPVP